MDYSRTFCTCGEHVGLGEWSPYKRAQTYSKMKRLGIALTDSQFKYLMSWEKKHGAVKNDQAA